MNTCRVCGDPYPPYGDGWDGMCPTCADKAEAQCECGITGIEAHTCPYAEDINHDFDNLCHCCDRCTQECANDI